MGTELTPRATDSGKRSKAIFIEPQILPWLASKAGVRLPVARAIWGNIASKRYADCDVLSCDEVARRQIDELRQQLKEAGEPSQNRPEIGSELLRWMFPFSLGLRRKETRHV